jgi:putative oxidoreductase
MTIRLRDLEPRLRLALARAIALHDRVFSTLQRGLDSWFLGLSARLVVAAVLLLYFWNSALSKVGDGFLGFFTISDNAYFQILPKVIERYEFDASQVPFGYDLIVVFGTYAEFLLPLLVVIGLFTRLASLGMIGFIAIQTYVDIALHAVDDKSVGGLFDRFSDSIIADQRLLWAFVLVYLVVRGAGLISLDHLLVRGRRLIGLTASQAAPGGKKPAAPSNTTGWDLRRSPG